METAQEFLLYQHEIIEVTRHCDQICAKCEALVDTQTRGQRLGIALCLEDSEENEAKETMDVLV